MAAAMDGIDPAVGIEERQAATVNLGGRLLEADGWDQDGEAEPGVAERDEG